MLNSTSMDPFRNGLIYHATEPLVLEITENVSISSTTHVGIESAAPVIIRSPAGRTLTILVNNKSAMLYGIKAPSVTLESGQLGITVNGRNDPEQGNAFGIWAGSGNVTISGGSVSTMVDTTGHKNKGIYASQFIIVSGGRITANQYGGKNTFGLDGGDVENESTDGGILITGGYITVNSSGAATRNIGIDSKFGTVRISSDPVILISEDESGARQNYAYNPDITTITGGKAVVFTSTGGNYTLRENAVLAKNATLIPGMRFEIPAGLSLGISEGTYLVKPADTTLLSGNGYGRFEYAKSFSGDNGAVIYAGRDAAQPAPAPLAGLLAGLAVAFILKRKK
nr:hypothetical protein [uncultured Methanoregula sp.]